MSCDQVVGRIDFSVDDLKRVLAYIVSVTMRYVLTRYSRFIKLAAIDTAVIVFLQSGILLKCECRSQARRSDIGSLRTTIDVHLASRCRVVAGAALKEKLLKEMADRRLVRGRAVAKKNSAKKKSSYWARGAGATDKKFRFEIGEREGDAVPSRARRFPASMVNGAEYSMRSLKPGAVDIDPISQRRRRRRPPLRPADPASHRHRHREQ
jgi:hypothetical protein